MEEYVTGNGLNKPVRGRIQPRLERMNELRELLENKAILLRKKQAKLEETIRRSKHDFSTYSLRIGNQDSSYLWDLFRLVDGNFYSDSGERRNIFDVLAQRKMNKEFFEKTLNLAINYLHIHDSDNPNLKKVEAILNEHQATPYVE